MQQHFQPTSVNYLADTMDQRVQRAVPGVYEKYQQGFNTPEEALETMISLFRLNFQDEIDESESYLASTQDKVKKILIAQLGADSEQLADDDLDHLVIKTLEEWQRSKDNPHRALFEYKFPNPDSAPEIGATLIKIDIENPDPEFAEICRAIVGQRYFGEMDTLLTYQRLLDSMSSWTLSTHRTHVMCIIVSQWNEFRRAQPDITVDVEGSTHPTYSKFLTILKNAFQSLSSGDSVADDILKISGTHSYNGLYNNQGSVN